MTRYKSASFAIAIAVLMLVAWPAVAQARVIERVSVNSVGTQANDWSDYATVSGDGRYVTFQSAADNLVTGDTNLTEDIFVRDRQTGTTVRVSLATDGTEGNGPSTFPSISADGAWVAFTSEADNLVAGDTNGVNDIFLHNMATGTTIRISVASDGTEANDESGFANVCADGSVVAYSSFATNLVAGDTNYDPAAGSFGEDVFVWVQATAVTERASVDTAGVQGDSDSLWPCLSADGRYVAFDSYATNLVPGDTNDTWRYLRARSHGRHHPTCERGQRRAPRATTAAAIPRISADGRYVAFDSPARQPRDRATPTMPGTLCPRPHGRDHLAGEREQRRRRRQTRPAGYPVHQRRRPLRGLRVVRDQSRARSGRDGVVMCSCATAPAGPLAGEHDHREPRGTVERRLLRQRRRPLCGLRLGCDQPRHCPTPTAMPTTCSPSQPRHHAYPSYRGSDRYDTAIKLSKALFPGALPADSGLVLAPGETFPEALCGAPLAAAYGGPVLLTYKTAWPTTSKPRCCGWRPSTWSASGSPATAVNAVISAMGPSVTVIPITGSRSSTS